MSLKTPMTYFGGKTRLADRIVALLPDHEHYVEPFGGSLAVLLAKQRSKLETVNDIDGDLMLFWRLLRERAADLERVCALTPHSRAEQRAAYDLSPYLDDLERARRVWVQLTQGRMGVRSKTGWRCYVDPAGTKTSMPGYLDGYVDRMAAAAERLHHVSLECRPALELIRLYGTQPSVLIYADPPYLASTRSGGRYEHELSTEEDHRELADVLLVSRAAVVLSGYQSQLYDQLYAGWDRVDILTFTGQGGTNGARTEVLWSNRPIAVPHLFSEDSA